MPIAGELLRDGILANLLSVQLSNFFFVQLVVNSLFRVRIRLFAQGLADDLGSHHWLLLEAIFEQISPDLSLLVLLLLYQMVLLIRAAAPAAL